MHPAAVERDAARLDRAGGVAAARVVLRDPRCGRAAALVRAAGAVLRGNVVLIREKARQVRRGEGLELLIVERLDGVHVVVRQLGRGVHRHAVKLHGARAADVVVVRDGHVFAGGGIAAHAGGVAADVHVRRAVVEPEGDVDALDLLDVVLVGERLREQLLAAVVLFERRDRGGLIQLEGQHVVGLERAFELPGHDGVVAAVGAGGRAGRFVADQLRAAARAGVDAQTFRVRAPVAAGGGGPFAVLRILFSLLEGVCGTCVLLGVERFDLRDLVARAAEVALELAGRAVEAQRSGAGGAFIVGDLSGHLHSPFLCFKSGGTAGALRRGACRTRSRICPC